VRRAAILLLSWLALAPATAWTEEGNPQVQVVDAYLELHTGPGRGYPVFHVVERGDRIEILKRHTDWFKIRTVGGKEGWVARAQMERTVIEAGVPTSFRDIVVEDYLRRRFELGFAGGTLEDDPLMIVRAGYVLTENLRAELTFGQASGDFSSSQLFYVGVRSEFATDWRISPFFTLGVGRFTNEPRATAVERIKTTADMANAGLGVMFYLTDRFVVRADYKRHVALIETDRTEEYNEVSLGISFFF
jgi:hypothetical protein